jgi:hypothetical protein
MMVTRNLMIALVPVKNAMVDEEEQVFLLEALPAYRGP